jgi:hypothetical protein
MGESPPKWPMQEQSDSLFFCGSDSSGGPRDTTCGWLHLVSRPSAGSDVASGVRRASGRWSRERQHRAAGLPALCVVAGGSRGRRFRLQANLGPHVWHPGRPVDRALATPSEHAAPEAVMDAKLHPMEHRDLRERQIDAQRKFRTKPMPTEKTRDPLAASGQ